MDDIVDKTHLYDQTVRILVSHDCLHAVIFSNIGILTSKVTLSIYIYTQNKRNDDDDEFVLRDLYHVFLVLYIYI